MRVLAYKGISWGSKLIRFYTRSDYSHIAIEWDSGKVTEALTRYGVILSNDYKEHHTPGTVVDVFDVAADEEMAWEFARGTHGDKYDLSALARFVTKRKRHTEMAWFCAEHAFETVLAGNLKLLDRVASETLSPGHVVSSPLLLPEGSRIV